MRRRLPQYRDRSAFRVCPYWPRVSCPTHPGPYEAITYRVFNYSKWIKLLRGGVRNFSTWRHPSHAPLIDSAILSVQSLGRRWVTRIYLYSEEMNDASADFRERTHSCFSSSSDFGNTWHCFRSIPRSQLFLNLKRREYNKSPLFLKSNSRRDD